MRRAASPEGDLFIPELVGLESAAMFSRDEYGEACRQVALCLKLRRERGIKPTERIVPFDRRDAAHATSLSFAEGPE
jgi:hypothetical protein